MNTTKSQPISLPSAVAYGGAVGVPAVAIFISIAMVVGIVVIGVFGPATKGIPLERINH